MNLDRVRVAWTGFPGGPGVSTFYAADGSSMLHALWSFFTDLSAIIPDDVTLQVENTGDRIDAVSGVLVGAFTGTAQEPIVGASAGAYPAPTGGVIDWLTGSIFDGHRLRGRTFVVPLTGTAYEVDGTLSAAVVAGLQAAGDAFLAGQTGNFMIWHRPFLGSPADPPRPARPAHDGSWAGVTSAHVPDKACVLRSRRD